MATMKQISAPARALETSHCHSRGRAYRVDRVMQDEISDAVTIAVVPAVADAELRRAMRKPPGSLDARAAYQRGLWHFSKFTADDNTVAQRFFQQAIDLDPNFAGGYWGLTWAQIGEASIFRRRNVAETLRSVEALARRAVALDGSDAEARSSLGLTLALLGDSKGGLAEIERALAISPNLASAHGALGAARPKRPYPLLSARKPKRSCARSLRRYSSGG
jgi:adenylate cyclase